MGDPKKSRKKYSRPLHPWQGERILKENGIKRKYGLKNKKEIWKAQTMLKKWRVLARDQAALIRAGNKQAEKESSELLKKLIRLGILKEGCKLHEILALELEDVLERRLQTLVYEKGMAHTTKQSRQFIIHGHVSILGRRINVPSYLVKIDEEAHISYANSSPLDEDKHAMRPQGNILEARQKKEEKEQMRKEKMSRNRGRGGR